MTEDEYVEAYNFIRRDVEYAIECHTSREAINDIAGSDSFALQRLNEESVIWIAIDAALFDSLIITLGRIFDEDDRTHSIHYLIRKTIRHPEFFSREALARRKGQHPGNDPDWLEERLNEAWMPAAADLRGLKTTVRDIARKYQQLAPIRKRVIAHRERLAKHEVTDILAKSLRTELEETLDSLHSLVENLWQLIYNGRKMVDGDQKSTYRQVTQRSALNALRCLGMEGLKQNDS